MKIRTKWNAVWISACMIGGMGITGHAVETGNDPAYTITIPSNITPNELVKTEESAISSTPFTVSASDFTNMDNIKLVVTVSTTSGKFELVDAKNHVLPYGVYNVENDGSALVDKAVFAEFASNGEKKGRIDIDQANIIAAGNYTGKITFTITPTAIGASNT